MKNCLKRSRVDGGGFHRECFRGYCSRCALVVRVTGVAWWCAGDSRGNLVTYGFCVGRICFDCVKRYNVVCWSAGVVVCSRGSGSIGFATTGC